MSFDFNLNNAEVSGGGSNELIPDGTVAKAIMTLRPADDGGYVHISQRGSHMLSVEWTITEGPYARRKIWAYMVTEGNETAVNITRASLRTIVECSRGIDPNDQSDAALKGRLIESFADLDGMECWLKIGIEKGTNGYSDKNKVVAHLRKGPESATEASGARFGANGVATPQPAPAAPVAASNKPAWMQ